ncbi:MAG: hypothetical protein R3E12_16610 [Candidatus Eisenbacteria bacterium]
MSAALRAAATPGIPIVAEMTFGEDGRTVEGESPGPLAVWMRGSGRPRRRVQLFDRPARHVLEVIEETGAPRRLDLLLAALPNAGSPGIRRGALHLLRSPEYGDPCARRFLKG